MHELMLRLALLVALLIARSTADTHGQHMVQTASGCWAPLLIAQWRCSNLTIPTPPPQRCRFCNYLHRPQPIPIEPPPKTPHIFRGSRLVNERVIQEYWRSQERLSRHVPIAEAPRRVYLDLGAREYHSSTKLFLSFYPKASTFELKAWEIVEKYHKTYADHPEVELFRAAAWTSDGTVSFANPRMAYAVHNVTRTVGRVFQVPTMDFSRYLRDNYRPDDFVVVKMDIEGGEFALLEKMLADSTIHLVDELFLECHCIEANFLPNLRGVRWPDCIKLFQTLRKLGVYVHEWVM